MKLGFSLVAVVAALALSPMANAALLAHYTFDEGAGTQAGDSSGNGFHAVQDSGTIGWVAQGAGADDGHIGPFAGDFNGSTDLIAPDILAGATQFTLSAWVNVDTTGGGYKGIFMSRVSNWGFARDGDGDHFDYRYDNTGGGSDGPDSAHGTASVDNWHHLAMTWRNDGTGEYYLNGALVGTKSGASTVYMDDVGTQNWFLGSDNGRNINAQIDDVAVWDVAVNGGVIAKLYRDGNNGINAAASVPEPSTVLITLMGLSMVGAAGMRRRLG